MQSIRFRAGDEVSDESREDLARGFAVLMAHGDGGPAELCLVQDGTLIRSELQEPHGSEPVPAARALIERLGGDEVWEEHLLQASLSASSDMLELRYVGAALERVDAEFLPYLMSRINWTGDNVERTYPLLLDRRRDEGSTLLHMAQTLEAAECGGQADVFRICAILRWARDEDSIPRSVDATLTLEGHELGYPPEDRGIIGLPWIEEALQALGSERTEAIVRARLESPEGMVAVLPLLGRVASAELLDHALSVMTANFGTLMSAADDEDEVLFAWRELGEAGLEALVRAHDEAKGKRSAKLRATIHQAVLVAVDAQVERDDGQLGASWERWLALESAAGKDDQWEESIGPWIRRILRRLAPDRVAEILDAAMERAGAELLRVFPLLDLGPPELCERALGQLVDDPNIRTKGASWIGYGVKRLGLPLVEQLQALLDTHPDEATQARLREAIGSDLLRDIVAGPRSTHADRLRKAAAKVPDSYQRTTIYALDEWEDVRAGPNTISRIGPTAIGVSEQRWPRNLDDEPMRHLLTVRLDELPFLAARHPDKAALALFLASDDGGHAYEPDNDDAAVVLLDESDLALGETQFGPDDDDDDDDELDLYGPSTRPLLVLPVEVPTDALASSTPPENKKLRKVYERLNDLPGRAGGPPDWLLSADHDGPFVLHVDEDLEYLSIPDRWRLYVFDDVAFWQSRSEDDE